MNNPKIHICKFGGAAVATPKHFSRIADIIISKRKQHEKIVCVVSAMGNTTDQLISLAKQVHPNPPQREYDMLVTVGERISISLLAMALSNKNCEAVSFTGSQSGIVTTNDHSNAKICAVKPRRIVDSLEKQKVVIVAGFQGVSTLGEITTLGRGGSDTTAVALGVALEAEVVEFFKDVPGMFTDDPKISSNAEHLSRLTYDQALDVVNRGGRILHPRCIELAKKNGISLYVRSFLTEQSGTHIFDPISRQSESPCFEVDSLAIN